MHYLEGNFDGALGKLVEHLVPSHHYCSVHDLFNPELFHQCLIAVIKEIPELYSHMETLTIGSMLNEHQQNTGYIEMRLHNFLTVWETMANALDLVGVNLGRDINKESLFKMVKHCDLDELRIMLQHFFELVIKNRQVVEFITTLEQFHQAAIRDFLERAKEKTEQDQESSQNESRGRDDLTKLEEENSQLRALLLTKESEAEGLGHQLKEREEEIQQLREIESSQASTIDSLKKRLLSYEQTDALFQEKDQEISRLQKQATEYQMGYKLLESQSSSEKMRLESKVKECQQSIQELSSKNEKLLASYQLAQRQREDTENSSKKVIANLRERVKTLTDKMTELQGQLVDSKIARELKDREYSDLLSSFQSLKSQSICDGNTTSEPTVQRDRQLSMEKAALGSGGRQFFKLEEELCELDKLKENAFEEEIMMFESSQDNFKKVQQILAENSRLKERMNQLESRGGREECQKLRKRIGVMKKRAETAQQQHREEIELLVSALQALRDPLV